MRYTIVSRGDDFSNSVVKDLHQRLFQIDLKHDEDHPDIVFTVGGDGTMLKAVHHYMTLVDDLVFVGIHTGKLGFYTDYIHDELDIIIEKLKQDDYVDVLFPLLRAEVCNGKGCKEFFALNEITLINPYHTQHIEVSINGEYFESFQGTGVCISTPSGSSAYNKSLGGALLHPDIRAFQLTEMGSINSNVYRTISSPMIFPSEHTITLKSTDFNEVTITIDHTHNSLKSYDYIKCGLSEKSVRFRQFRSNDFWQRVQKSFL
jgi:NAD+ kinase